MRQEEKAQILYRSTSSPLSGNGLADRNFKDEVHRLKREGIAESGSIDDPEGDEACRT
jgi:hypothetical protein